jgi:hypothetical protein
LTGSEKRLPPGSTKGRCLRTPAFWRCRANCGNGLRPRRTAQSLKLRRSRAMHWPPCGRSAGPISAETLGRLSVSRRLGSRLLPPLNRSELARLLSARLTLPFREHGLFLPFAPPSTKRQGYDGRAPKGRIRAAGTNC